VFPPEDRPARPHHGINRVAEFDDERGLAGIEEAWVGQRRRWI
jgi:hypothetical protein